MVGRDRGCGTEVEEGNEEQEIIQIHFVRRTEGWEHEGERDVEIFILYGGSG